MKSIKFNKFLIFFMAIFTCFSLCFLTGCSEKKLAIKDFVTEKSTYENGDKMNFILTFENPNNYDVISCVINDLPFSLTPYALKTDKFIAETTITYEVGKKYVLSEVTYIKDESSYILEVNKTAITSIELSTVEDMKVTKLSITSLDNDEIFANDNISAVVTVKKNVKDVQILTFYFTFTDVNGSQEMIKKNIIDDGTSNVYTVPLTMPAMVGNVNATVSRVDYVKKTDSKYLTQDIVKQELVVNIHDVEVLEASIDMSSKLNKDVNDLSYFDSSSSIKLEITLSNNSNVNVTELTVSGSTVKITDKDIERYDLLEKMVITKTITLDVEKSPIKLTLDSVCYTSGGAKRTIGETLFEEDYYFYNKIIKTSTDFNDMIVDNETKKITGRYILDNDITLSGNERYLFNDYILDGTIEFNGHTVTSNVVNTKPMFEKITENGVVQNMCLNYSMSNAPAICDGNYGDIVNIKMTNSVMCSKTETTNDLKSVNALCNNNMLAGKIQGVEFASQLIGSSSFFSVVGKNYGEYKNIIINPSQISLGKNTVFALPETNVGEVSSVVILVEQWFTGLSAEDYEAQNNLVIAYDGGTYKNIVLNKDFVDKVNTFNTIINGPSVESGVLGKLMELPTKAINGVFEMIKEGDSSNFLAYLGFGEPRTNWLSYANGGTSADIVSSVKEFEKKALTQDLYTGFGFMSYSESNNYFWRYSGGTINLNFKMK